MSDPRFSKPEAMTFDHPFTDDDDCGYCHDCGAAPLFHDEDALNRVFDWMERMSRR